MTTKLDSLVGHLAGREVDPGLLEELTDPTSEASLFLEGTRSYSRALIDVTQTNPPVPRSRTPRLLGVLALILLILAWIVGIYLFVEFRLARIEAMEARNQSVIRERAAEVESKLSKIVDAQPDKRGFEQIQDSLEKIAKRLDHLEQPPPQPNATSSSSDIRDGMNALRREITALEKGNARQAEDLRASTLEIARLVRLLISRTQPAPPPESPNDLRDNRRP